ncbi:MAG: monovalent cation/H(+) antiporter subunit G [Synechococcaceae cyanobacterium]|jgi:multicomponent Na+:H+ antiporter subunit G
MSSFFAAAGEVVSLGLLALGLVFWFAGTWPLLGNASFLTKLHYLGVADTLGSALMVLGLLVRLNREWPLLLLALLSLIIWDTIFGYVLAACSQAPARGEDRTASPSPRRPR